MTTRAERMRAQHSPEFIKISDMAYQLSLRLDMDVETIEGDEGWYSIKLSSKVTGKKIFGFSGYYHDILHILETWENWNDQRDGITTHDDI